MDVPGDLGSWMNLTTKSRQVVLTLLKYLETALVSPPPDSFFLTEQALAAPHRIKKNASKKRGLQRREDKIGS